MLLRVRIFLFLFGLFAHNVVAQELPPIEVYTPQMYNAGNQNWAIAQSDDKHIYVANHKGLLEFNGANWQLYSSPNETILRSVAATDNTIYTGCYMDFGHWQRNVFGMLEYESLSNKLNIEMLEDEQIWKILTHDNWIVFQSLQRIYLYNTSNDSFKIIEARIAITTMFLVDETIMFQQINDGIYKIENGIAQLVSSGEPIKNNPVINVFPYGGNYLFQTSDKGFYILNESGLKKWEIEANDFLEDVTVFSSIQLKDKSFVLGTISNGIIYLTADGKVNYQINQINGLSNNTVLSVFEDVENNIWLGLDNGVNCVNMKSPLRVYNDQIGNLGTVYTTAIYKDNLYLGTNQGLFYKKQATHDDFKFIKGTKGQVWKLISFDGTLFCGHNAGTFIIESDKARLIASTSGTWDIKPLGNSENELLQGNYEGLNVLEKTNNGWKLKNKVEGFNSSSRFFEIGPKNTVYVSHEYKGVFDLKLNDDFTKVLKVSKIPELPKGLDASLVKYQNEYLYAYKGGVLRYDEESKMFKKDSLYSSVFKDQNYITGKQIVDLDTNRLWNFGDRYISYINPGKLSKTPEINKIAIPSSLRNEMTGYENITHINDQTYLLGTSNGYMLINLNEINEKIYAIKINSIKSSTVNGEGKMVNLSENEDFKNIENTIEFKYSVPAFYKYAEVDYQYQLKGIHDKWSSWSTKSSVLFENLRYGDYTFNVRGRIGEQITANKASYSFKINRPWYLSNTMIILYALGFILFSLMMHNIYKKYYRKQREKLLEKTKKELKLKELENQQQLMRFKNETLSQDIESKNRELAISTMSLIKKNEFLNSIKKELNDANDSKDLKSVVKIIDLNLNNTDDWKFFQEAFNNADKDFLKKVKAIHSKLTPNDLRLCAYLRLNLSSKEIAPLLNISSRSVEVKRYRLRKKMELPHEASLTNYILEI